MLKSSQDVAYVRGDYFRIARHGTTRRGLPRRASSPQGLGAISQEALGPSRPEGKSRARPCSRRGSRRGPLVAPFRFHRRVPRAVRHGRAWQGRADGARRGDDVAARARLGRALAVGVRVILDRITSSLAAAEHRKDEGFRVLRQALGYGWSVAAAAAPENAWPYFEKWLLTRDKDVAWVMKTNLEKARLTGLRQEIATRATPKPKAKPKAKAKPKPKPTAATKTKKRAKRGAR